VRKKLGDFVGELNATVLVALICFSVGLFAGAIKALSSFCPLKIIKKYMGLVLP
jgi:hypothetical protein